VSEIVTANASSFGIFVCRRFCNGQTRAMAKNPNANGANTELASLRAAASSTAAMIATAIRMPANYPLLKLNWRWSYSKRQSMRLIKP
jgi:hypothetical protein